MTVITSTTVLTPADLAGQLRANGLDALGLTVPTLGTAWGSATPASGDVTNDLRLSLTGLRAPFTGTYERWASASGYAGPDGTPITTTAGILRMHPEAVHKLETLVRARLGRLDRPLPVAMLVHGVAAEKLAAWFRGGEAITPGGPVSFHDRRGLVIDPIAVASLFADLLSWLPALAGTGSTAAVNSAGGVASIAALGSPQVLVHVVDPHGAPYVAHRQGAEMQELDPLGDAVQEVPADGLLVLPDGHRVGRVGSDVPTPPEQEVMWGPCPGGELGFAAFAPPALPTGVSLPRQFFRLMAADPDWHLLGNRDFDATDPAPAETDMPPHAPLPDVRLVVSDFTFLLDGNDCLGAMADLVTTWPTVSERLALLSSPVIEAGLRLPPAPGSAGHWPAFPPGPAPSQADVQAMRTWDPVSTALPVTAAWRLPSGSAPLRDVVVTVPSGALPVGTHVRAFPRSFRRIDGIGEDPSFVRGDGGAAVVAAADTAAGGTRLLLINPFGLGATEAAPSPARLSLDLVLVARDGTRRMVSQLDLDVGPTQAWSDNAAVFGGNAPALVAALLAGQGFTAAAPVSVFGIPVTGTLPPRPSATAPLADWAAWLANEGSWPRHGPRLPTQARFDTVLALGAVVPGAPTYAWNAVLTGARWSEESRCASPELGDPGNPAGPDVHATGVRVGGQLARDLALHAIKRCQSVLPLTTGTGWVLTTAGDNWNVPAPDPVPAAGRPCMTAAVLETVAAVVDSPELAVLPVPDDTVGVQSLADQAASLFGLPAGSVTVSLANEPRIRRQLQREIATAKRGQRDAMWSLARAVSHAREYVLIEAPSFARTTHPDVSHPENDIVDLVGLLAQRLDDNPRLKVLLCLPRLPDFEPSLAPWVRAALAERKAALDVLTNAGGAAGMRVAAFHPIGFPGRPVVGRSTVVLVDDVYAMVGTSHWRRRGMTFDGGCDVVSFDRRLDDRGTSGAVARFRQRLLAARLGVPVPAGAASSNALWTRLAEPESAYDAVTDLLAAGGLGRCQPVWAGPQDRAVIPADVQKIDPNGLSGLSPAELLTGLVP